MQGVPEEGLIHSKKAPGFYIKQIGGKRAEIAPTQFLLQSCVIRQNPKIFWAIFVQNVLCQDDDDDVIREQLQCILNSFACSDKILPEN